MTDTDKTRSRGWHFTNYVLEFTYETLECDYIIVGDEICPKTGRPHHQGYMYSKARPTRKTIRAMLPPGTHVESAKGSPQQGYAYCTKEKILYERGDRPMMGKRNDIVKVREILKETGSMREVVRNVNSYQACRMGELILKYDERKRDFKPTVRWYWGPTGSGKTKTAMEETKDPWVSGKNLKWWEGYDAHSHVIIDDFRKDFCTFHELLRILDRYEFRIENKGGSRQLLAELIIITSCYKPEDVYDTREDVGQLLRRIDEVRYIGPPPVVPDQLFNLF